MYTQDQLEKALALHTRLVHDGLDPDYAELQVLRVVDTLGTTAVPDVAAGIVETAEDRWKRRESSSTGGKGNFFDELRRRIEAERAARGGRGQRTSVR